MSKKERLSQVLVGLFEDFSITDNDERIREYLTANSNLPGPRGNLELAYAFADVSESFSASDPERIWGLALRLASIPASEAPVNDPREFLSFCGAVLAGAVGSAQDRFYGPAMELLRRLAVDSRWRTREGVATGIQRLIAARGQDVLRDLRLWVVKNDWLVMRAVAAGVAEPALLRDEQAARPALELHRMIITRILSTRDKKTDEFKTLRKTLGYSLSVVVCFIPEDGFTYMRQLANSEDLDIAWVIRENLKKNRLLRSFPDEVATIRELLERTRAG